MIQPYDPTRDDLELYSACKEHLRRAMTYAQDGAAPLALDQLGAIVTIAMSVSPQPRKAYKIILSPLRQTPPVVSSNRREQRLHALESFHKEACALAKAPRKRKRAS